jgi:Ser/Thr protein kinase RdoA (MazF antagonist)
MTAPAPIPAPLAVRYSTLSAAAAGAFVAAHYDLAAPLACTFLRRGFNDSFVVRDGAGRRYVLRVSGWRARGEADVAGETAFLVYLDGLGIPVAAPVRARDGGFFCYAMLPEGRRAAVLFRHAEGRSPRLDAPADAHAQGVTLARIHDAAPGFAGGAGRYRLDLDHLLHREVAAVLALDAADAQAKESLPAIASRLAAAVAALDGLTWTRCHGDCHGINARIATEGPQAGQAVFFDFDDGGPGYLAYDIAVHLWAQVSFGRKTHAMWHAFMAGYRSVRAIAAVDFEAVHLFVPIRHIWLMGEYAGRLAEWGSEAVPPTFVAKEVAFLQAWEEERLSHRLW